MSKNRRIIEEQRLGIMRNLGRLSRKDEEARRKEEARKEKMYNDISYQLLRGKAAAMSVTHMADKLGWSRQKVYKAIRDAERLN